MMSVVWYEKKKIKTGLKRKLIFNINWTSKINKFGG